MLFLADGSPFATGSADYLYQPATENETTPRICIEVSFDGIKTLAMVDTGAPHTILDPEIAEAIGVDLQSGIPLNRVTFRNDTLDGYLHRLTIQFISSDGENLPVEATVFIPEPKPFQEWVEFPTVIGLNSCLERLRFAIDPSVNRFYFGELP